ncbi:MAG TPA: recombinase RecT [Propionibacteriaceae bacterium]|jgi:recombination protein RecT
MTQTIGQAVATRDNTPAALIRQYSNDFKTVLPSHVRPDTWVRLAQGALKKGKKATDGRTELEVAAANNPGVFLAAVLDAARLGLEPGSEQFYLTPRKVKGRLEILGIVGYQGHIELMYRAGAISSVVAECVYENDGFDYQPGRDQKPVHTIDWDAADRGMLRLVYAYAIMRDRAVSKVIVLNRAAINKIKASSQGSDSEYSPWKNHEHAMWLKSAVRQLQKWVPTSAEYRDALRSDAVEVQRARAEAERPTYAGEPLPHVDTDTGEILEEPAEGEIVDAEYDPTTEPDWNGGQS